MRAVEHHRLDADPGPSRRATESSCATRLSTTPASAIPSGGQAIVRVRPVEVLWPRLRAIAERGAEIGIKSLVGQRGHIRVGVRRGEHRLAAVTACRVASQLRAALLAGSVFTCQQSGPSRTW